MRCPLNFEAAAAFWSPFFSPAVLFGLGLQLPFSPCFLPGVGSYPGQHAFASLDFLPPASFFAVFLPGVFFVSAPVMCRRLAAVLVSGDLVARFTAADFFAGVFAADFFAPLFFAVLFFADAPRAVAFDAELFEALLLALDFFVADFFVVAIFA